MHLPLAIECENITKHYPHFSLRDVNLSFEQGSVMGLVGPNGAGKSTLLRIAMGLITPDSGSIEVLGHSMPSAQIEARRRIGFVAEDMRLYESETIAFHMDFIKSIFDSWDDQYANALLHRFDLNKNQRVKGMSHGQRVKATLLLALARRPQLLVFDEPTTGLDPVVRKEVLNEMMNSMEDETHSILFSSHNTLDVEQISDYITFVYDGRIIESHNKEDFIDSWRRLRLTNMNNKPLPVLPTIKDVQQSSRLCTLTLNQYDDSISEQFTQAGLHVDHIERLTLEEIFLSTVLHAKQNSHVNANTKESAL